MRGRKLKILTLTAIAALVAVLLFKAFQPSIAFRAHWDQRTDVRILDYKHSISGFEDHEHYWRIQLASDDVDRFISANGLKAFDNRATNIPVNLIPWMNEDAPPWWPPTPDKVFVKREQSDLNALVIEDGECFLFRFSE